MLSKNFFSGKISIMNKRGFTLIELLITIAIIGILAAVATTAYIGTTKKAARSEAYSNLESIRLLEEQVYADSACYKPNDDNCDDIDSLGANDYAACDTFAESAANLDAIDNVLTRFRPGNDTQFCYWITFNVSLPPPPVAMPFAGVTVARGAEDPPCFIATATGIIGTRVAGDVFVIDCNNNRNF